MELPTVNRNDRSFLPASTPTPSNEPTNFDTEDNQSSLHDKLVITMIGTLYTFLNISPSSQSLKNNSLWLNPNPVLDLKTIEMIKVIKSVVTRIDNLMKTKMSADNNNLAFAINHLLLLIYRTRAKKINKEVFTRQILTLYWRAYKETNFATITPEQKAQKFSNLFDRFAFDTPWVQIIINEIIETDPVLIHKKIFHRENTLQDKTTYPDTSRLFESIKRECFSNNRASMLKQIVRGYIALDKHGKILAPLNDILGLTNKADKFNAENLDLFDLNDFSLLSRQKVFEVFQGKKKIIATMIFNQDVRIVIQNELAKPSTHKHNQINPSPVDFFDQTVRIYKQICESLGIFSEDLPLLYYKIDLTDKQTGN